MWRFPQSLTEGMIARTGDADVLRGMHVTTAAEPERGRAHARLYADLVAFDRLTTDRCPAAARLVETLGEAMAQKLVFALTASGGRSLQVATPHVAAA